MIVNLACKYRVSYKNHLSEIWQLCLHGLKAWPVQSVWE